MRLGDPPLPMRAPVHASARISAHGPSRSAGSAAAPLFTGAGIACVRGERTVFTGLDFTLGAGEVLVLLGPNGSGKSSLLRLMAGLLKPAAGVLAWDGNDVAPDPEAHHRRLHYVGHLDATKPALTVAENLHFWARLAGDGAPAPNVAVPNVAARSMAALARLGLDPLADIPCQMLSAGQRRRLALARILASPAPLWLLDEPTVALDAASVTALEEAIAEHRADGGMAVIATHAALGLDAARELHLTGHGVRHEARTEAEILG